MELGGLEPPTSWVRFAENNPALQGICGAVTAPRSARMHADYRRLSPFQALLAMSAWANSSSRGLRGV
jgi:hypothetical protein